MILPFGLRHVARACRYVRMTFRTQGQILDTHQSILITEVPKGIGPRILALKPMRQQKSLGVQNLPSASDSALPAEDRIQHPAASPPNGRLQLIVGGLVAVRLREGTAGAVRDIGNLKHQFF